MINLMIELPTHVSFSFLFHNFARPIPGRMLKFVNESQKRKDIDDDYVKTRNIHKRKRKKKEKTTELTRQSTLRAKDKMKRKKQQRKEKEKREEGKGGREILIAREWKLKEV